jgi:hypothetical protein
MMRKATMATNDDRGMASALVVHPLDDDPEEKLDTSKLPPMPMTLSVRLSLIALRTYLFVMTALVVYHVFDLAGVFHGRGR